MSTPEASDFESEICELEDRIVQTARFVIDCLSQDFSALPEEEIEDYNLRIMLNGDPAVLRSCRLRRFEMEDPELLTPIDLQDSYFDYVVQGEDAHSHVLSLIIQNTEQKYLLTLDLSDGGVAITTGEMSEDVPPERYPKLCEQMLGSLSLIADTLVIAA